MLKEVIVVEGRSDVAAVRRAVDADCLVTRGFTLDSHALDDIAGAYRRRGIIVLTDPDSSGERIRRQLAERFPESRHAFVPRESATLGGDIGVENASPESIRAALAKARARDAASRAEFSPADLLSARLTGARDSHERRARVGARLGVGYATAKAFLRRLNHYGVTRVEFDAAVRAADGEEPA